MNSESTCDETTSFHKYLTRRLQSGTVPDTPEKSVEEFRAYQNELERFLVESEPSFVQAQNGQHSTLDVDFIMNRVAKRISSSVDG